jgi:hypothetical protein
LGAPIFFALFGWVLGAGRRAVRGEAALAGLQMIQRGGSYFTGEALIDDRGEWTSNPGISLGD